MRPAGPVPGGSGEVPGSSREALGDCGRFQESPEGSREAPGGFGKPPEAQMPASWVVLGGKGGRSADGAAAGLGPPN